MYEYGIAADTSPHELHRGPMSEDEAYEWMDAMSPQADDMFLVVRREVSPWSPVD